ncbi:predicted protein [Uncinocarpus reesii 1704]|uniref:Uncharacterized protein n=1 Tax=Uncinocarpus reesii (strain UAMH 1704) TaxID=336963 RepID=C4JZD4_UNCRE|nr:uncharacterized protein UREG_07535 [Uncinocarpus reesii 1704]EEP82670.1 predicted protein [Uncinocarpus reesii 1704]
MVELRDDVNGSKEWTSIRRNKVRETNGDSVAAPLALSDALVMRRKAWLKHKRPIRPLSPTFPHSLRGSQHDCRQRHSRLSGASRTGPSDERWRAFDDGAGIMEERGGGGGREAPTKRTTCL